MPLPSHLHLFHVLNTTGSPSRSQTGSSLFIPTATALSAALSLMPENRASLPHLRDGCSSSALYSMFPWKWSMLLPNWNACYFLAMLTAFQALCFVPGSIHLIYCYIIYCSNRRCSHSCPLWDFWYVLRILPTYQVLVLFFKYLKIFHICYIHFIILFILLYIVLLYNIIYII